MILSYCWWKKSQTTTWDVQNPVDNWINYQPQLVSLPDFWTINSRCSQGVETIASASQKSWPLKQRKSVQIGLEDSPFLLCWHFCKGELLVSGILFLKTRKVGKTCPHGWWMCGYMPRCYNDDFKYDKFQGNQDAIPPRIFRFGRHSGTKQKTRRVGGE